MFDLTGDVAVVTGGGTGLGKKHVHWTLIASFTARNTLAK